ncbi:TlpA family protein disulfide reductase [Euzebyella marina]|uniref:TlpA family protein disulfide reductase n=1 Tax=Euzebyella marina TaxID=1761453 RepID=A0A3G2L6P3_9FLAO|nr:TlpA disulfide reductase family protein [Euzebyella marina]AYN67925.1 TlpA family protein disulfide reductase [Euzebyella marina]
MRYYLSYFIIFLLILASCKKHSRESTIADGLWLGELEAMDGYHLPFNFRLIRSENDSIHMEIYNADETIKVDEITIKQDSIIIHPPVFEGYFAGIFTEKSINGRFIKEELNRSVPFSAHYGQKERFKTGDKANVNVSGNWETVFSDGTDDRYVAKGVFEQKGKKVTGTFETATGDYRFLEGVVTGDSLKLSAFDGSHAFLFVAKATDSLLDGMFYSGNHFKEPFQAKRNDAFELPDADSLTFLKPGYDSFNFTFPNALGEQISLKDEQFKDKVVLLQIMGTWCPNCLDETKFYVDYIKKNRPDDVAMVALAFEYAKTEASAFKSINRLVERVDVPYPILLAQYGTTNKTEAQKKLPMLNHVLSYPTTIYLDKKGAVRKIHTGFNGPATGDKFVEFKSEFETFVQQLREE